MSQTLTVLGNISAEQFLAEYWQKKPLLVRNAIPEIAGILEPSDVMELALEEEMSARLIKQKDRDPNQWTLKSSPLIKADFQKMPKLWSLLVQAVDHYSFDLAAMWKKFPFIPQWRREDIMVSYAPKGGSVGKHFDFYDVFLVQGHGHRRWQLGQMCDESTEFVAGQPLKLLADLDVHFDEVLAPGDLLYVPPGLAHYGVAEDDCLTYSFGFRMPNISDMVDSLGECLAVDSQLSNPLIDVQRQQTTSIGEISAKELEYLRDKLLAELQNPNALNEALMTLISRPGYPNNIPENDPLGVGDLEEALDQGYLIKLEPASRLLYSQFEDELRFWANGESLQISAEFASKLKLIADGAEIELNEDLYDQDILENIAELLNSSIIMLLPAEEVAE